MTFENLIEEVEEMFVHTPLTRQRIIKEFDKAQKRFNDDTHIISTRASLSGIGSARSFSLPADFYALDKVEFLNTNGEVLPDHPLVWTIENDKIIFDSKLYTITSIPTYITTIYIYYTQVPTTLTADTDSLEVIEQFQDALTLRVLEKLHTVYNTIPVQDRDGNISYQKDWNAIRYYNGQYKERVRDAKKYLNTIDNSQYDIKLYDSAVSIPHVAGGD